MSLIVLLLVCLMPVLLVGIRDLFKNIKTESHEALNQEALAAINIFFTDSIY